MAAHSYYNTRNSLFLLIICTKLFLYDYLYKDYEIES